MKEYTVIEIADILKTKPSTVRRWIREGQIKAVQESRKQGNVVSEEELQKFLNNNEKYATIAKDAVTSNAMKQISTALNDIDKVNGKENFLTSIVPAIALGGALGGLSGAIGGTAGAIAGGVIPVIPALGATGVMVANEISKNKQEKKDVKKMQEEIDELQKRIDELKNRIKEEENDK